MDSGTFTNSGNAVIFIVEMVSVSCVDSWRRLLTCKPCPSNMEIARGTELRRQVLIVATIGNKRNNVLHFFGMSGGNVVVYVLGFFPHNFLIMVLRFCHITLYELAYGINERRQIRKCHFTGNEICINRRIFKIILLLHTDKDNSLSVLRHTVIGSTQNLIFYIITKSSKSLNDIVLNFTIKESHETGNILNNKHFGSDFLNQSNITQIEFVSGVVEISRPRQGEPLARRSTDNNINLFVTNQRFNIFLICNLSNITTDGFCPIMVCLKGFECHCIIVNA